MKLTKNVKARTGLNARMGMKASLGLVARLAVVAVVAFGLVRSPAAHADTLLKAATTLVVGSSADTYSISAPSAGTLTASVSSVPWPTALSALSFNVTDSSSLLNPMSKAQAFSAIDSGGPQVESYQVGPGTYFAHVSATAGGALNLGLYSVMFTFTPSAVPLPATVGMLLIGLLVLFGLRRTTRGPLLRNESVMSAA